MDRDFCTRVKAATHSLMFSWINPSGQTSVSWTGFIQIMKEESNRRISEAKWKVQVNSRNIKVPGPSLEKMYFNCQILSQCLPSTTLDMVPDTAVSAGSVARYRSSYAFTGSPLGQLFSVFYVLFSVLPPQQQLHSRLHAMLSYRLIMSHFCQALTLASKSVIIYVKAKGWVIEWGTSHVSKHDKARILINKNRKAKSF